MVSRSGSADGPTRQSLMDVAITLFVRHSVAGTSLQMISDALGLTKSAIYHHFRTRDELLSAIIEPIVDQLADVVRDAEARRTAPARAERMLTGYADLAVTHRDLFPVFSGDPGVVDFLRTRPAWAEVVRRQAELFTAVDPGPGGQVRAAVVMAGMAAAVGVPFDGLSDEAVREELLAAGRRTLGLRTPRVRTG